MNRTAFDKIVAGLNEALEVARGNATGARVQKFCRVCAKPLERRQKKYCSHGCQMAVKKTIWLRRRRLNLLDQVDEDIL